MRYLLSLALAASVTLTSAVAQPVDLIVTARHVVTMDASRRVIDNGAIAVTGNKIVAVGPAAEIAAKHPAKQRIDRPGALLAPGLINTHCHAPMVLLRGIADDLNLQDWLEKYIFPAEAKNVSADFVRWGARLAVWEMLRGGVTTYADMYYFEETIAEETKRAGMRGVLGQTVIKFPVADAKSPEEALKRTEAFILKFKDDPLIVPAVAPHAPYTNSDEVLRACRRLADKYKVPLLTHLSETKRENDDAMQERNMSPTKRLDMIGFFDGPTLVAHAVWLDDADIAILAQRGVGVAHNPSSNMKLASGVAPVLKMLAAGVAVGLGTDGPAGSNNDLNMFEEMDLAAKLQKVSAGDPKALPAEQTVAMATILGAKAMGLDAKIGSLEPGKLADFITVDIEGAHAIPLFNVYSSLVYALKASDVRDVAVNGRLVVRDRNMLTLDPALIRAKTAEIRRKVGESLAAPK
jgi:5-methylthioadenosine/S-adenosylhomocysteine deaminase